MLKRIKDVHSVFSSNKWEEERKEMERRIKEMSEFDATGNPKGFSAGVSNTKVRLLPCTPLTVCAHGYAWLARGLRRGLTPAFAPVVRWLCAPAQATQAQQVDAGQVSHHTQQDDAPRQLSAVAK